MKLEAVANILVTANVGVLGSTLFINTMPADCVKGVLLRDGFSGTRLDHELPNFYQTDFQLIVRSKDYIEGRNLIEAAITALTVKIETVYGNMNVKYMRPRSLPFNYPLSPGNLTEFVTQIDCAFNIV